MRWLYNKALKLFGITEVHKEIADWGKLVSSYNGKIKVTERGGVRLEFETPEDESRYWRDQVKNLNLDKMR